jgi:hypothetical protein
MLNKDKYWENRKAGKRGQAQEFEGKTSPARKGTRAYKRAELRLQGKLKGNKRNQIDTITKGEL